LRKSNAGFVPWPIRTGRRSAGVTSKPGPENTPGSLSDLGGSLNPLDRKFGDVFSCHLFLITAGLRTQTENFRSMNIPSGQVRHGAFAFVLELHASDLSGATSFLGNQALARLNAGLFISSDITDGRFSRAGKSPGNLNSSVAARVPGG
jgi:hypothetical protein